MADRARHWFQLAARAEQVYIDNAGDVFKPGDRHSFERDQRRESGDIMHGDHVGMLSPKYMAKSMRGVGSEQPYGAYTMYTNK
jgi:hypothetical protein